MFVLDYNTEMQLHQVLKLFSILFRAQQCQVVLLPLVSLGCDPHTSVHQSYICLNYPLRGLRHFLGG